MDRTVENIALEPIITQNEDDDEGLNKRKFHLKSDDIQNQRKKYATLIRIFNSKKYSKEFVLWIVLFICLIVIAGPLSLHISSALPSIKARNIATDIFSEERARDYLINLTQHGSRVSNTQGNFYARHFLISQIEHIISMNKRHFQFEVYLQNLTDLHYNQLQNIIVHVSNSSANHGKNVSSLMLTAHYDSVEFSPGGSDDGSGVVILLELFSNLINDLTITFSNVNLIVLFTNGEEMGLTGAKAFITNYSWRFNIRRFIYIDAANCNEKASLARMKPSQLAIDYSRVSRPRANVIIENMQKWIGFMGDYDTYVLNGSLLGYEFGFLLDGYTYHTPLDDLSMIKEGVLQDLGENLGILIRNILLGDFHETENIIDNDPLIYFDIFGRYLIVYKMSTSIIIQRILIILIIIVGIIRIIFDDIYHRKRSLKCIDSRCIYFHFKYPFIIRIISIMIYFLSNLMSIFVGLAFSMIIGWIMSIIHPLSWFGNSTLAIFLFSLPCLIGFIIVGEFWDSFHGFILRKWPQNSSRMNLNIDIKHLNFDFEQNLSVLFIYGLLMIISIYSNTQIFYIILIWSIFICPIYLLMIIIEFIIHYKNFFNKRYHWIYCPLIISLFPLIHTIEIMDRLIRIFIPFLAKRFSFGWSFHGNFIICIIIAIPTVFFVLIFIPILQRTKQFGRTLIILLITFFIIFIVAYFRQPFTNIHPNIFYAEHRSKSIFKVETLSNIPSLVPLVSKSSTIRVITYDGLVISPVLDHFSAKSGHILHNKQCIRPTNCTFDDTFNRTIAIQHIEIESMKNFTNYTIIVRHVLSYNIRISSFSFIDFIVRNQLNIPRTETIIDVTLNSSLLSFDISINIRRCELTDSPFLLLFTRLMPNIVLMGRGECQAINDDTTLIIDIKTSFNQNKNKIEV